VLEVRIRQLIAQWEHDRLNEDETSTPRGVTLTGELHAADLAYRLGHNAMRKRAIADVRALLAPEVTHDMRTMRALDELREVAP
jgi:hypothetical protein